MVALTASKSNFKLQDQIHKVTVNFKLFNFLTSNLNFRISTSLTLMGMTQTRDQLIIDFKL